MSASPSKTQIFWQRLGSTLGLWTVVLLAVFAPNPTVANTTFLAILLLLGIVGFREFCAMITQAGMTAFPWPALIAGIGLLSLEVFHGWNGSQVINDPARMISTLPTNETATNTHYVTVIQPGIYAPLVATGLFLWLTTLKLRSAGKIKLASIAITLFGWFYVFWLLSYIAKIYYFPNAQGTWLLLYFILVTKFSDLGAYVVGSLFGRHKMAPNISPGKTWEGFAGAIVVSTLISIITIYASGAPLAALRGAHAITLGVVLSALAVVGDLVESLIKRETQVKDSGSLFPGIGGCLDLIDSLLFNAPVFYLYCWLTLTS